MLRSFAAGAAGGSRGDCGNGAAIPHPVYGDALERVELGSRRRFGAAATAARVAAVKELQSYDEGAAPLPNPISVNGGDGAYGDGQAGTIVEAP